MLFGFFLMTWTDVSVFNTNKIGEERSTKGRWITILWWDRALGQLGFGSTSQWHPPTPKKKLVEIVIIMAVCLENQL